MNNVMSLMQAHSSVRAFTSEKIDQDLLQIILSCGQSAASSSFIQAYSFVRITNVQTRKAIAEIAGGQTWVIDAPEFLVLCADLNRVNYASNKTGEGDLEGYTEHSLAATIDVALAAQNMMLAAESAGLGGVFIGGIRNDAEAVAELLGLPDFVYPAFGFCFGWPSQKNEVKPRMPVSAVLHEERYNSDGVAEAVDAYDQQMSEYYSSRSMSGKVSNWSAPTTRATQMKKREAMQKFLNKQMFFRR